MKRLLCALLLGGAAVTAVPAQAGGYDVDLLVWNDEGRVGVGARYSLDGRNYEPVGGVWVNRATGEVCAGFSYQVAQCVGGPIS